MLYQLLINLCTILIILHQLGVVETRGRDDKKLLPIDLPLSLLKRSEALTQQVDLHSILRVNESSLKWLIKSLDSSVYLYSLKNDIGDLYNGCSKRFYVNQHGSELWFPFLLRHHPYASKHLVYNISEDSDILFYFVEAHPSLYLECTKIDGWGKIVKSYWEKTVNELENGIISNKNEDDFIIPASHPTLPSHFLPRATFLTVDFEGNGKYPKDIVIPYVADIVINITQFNSHNPERDLLLFFASLPVQRVRTALVDMLTNIAPDIIIRKNDVLPHEYIDYLRRSKFCLAVVGDTTSSRRLFGNMYHGCIPVIVSDWIVLPFSRFLDYSTFSITIEEGLILSHPQKVIEYLRSIPQSRIEELQAALWEARAVLMYDSSNMLNPVSLVIADAVLIRVEMCLQGSGGLSSSHMKPICAKLLKRFRGHRSLETFSLRHMAAMFVDKRLL